jgi:Na+/H+ antiporter NhaD/arsenite permease-like protein
VSQAASRFRRRPAKILAGRDPVRCMVWAGTLVLAGLALIVRPKFAWQAAHETAMPFLTLAAIIATAALADRIGAFGLLARVMNPGTSSPVVAVAGVLLFTAALSGLVNLDVAVVVALPVALTVAGRTRMSAGWLAAAVAVTANATSFLLPTSNITTLLVLSSTSDVQVSYVRDSWVAWVLVTVVTAGLLSVVVARHGSGGTPTATARGPRLVAVIDLLPMFLAAAAIRDLLLTGVVLRGSFIEQVAFGSVFGAAANNLPAAAAVHVTGPTGLWAAVLAMSIGPNLLITGSVATLICRRIARDSGVTLDARTFMALGVLLVPIQLAVGYAGLQCTGALLH